MCAAAAAILMSSDIYAVFPESNGHRSDSFEGKAEKNNTETTTKHRFISY